MFIFPQNNIICTPSIWRHQRILAADLNWPSWFQESSEKRVFVPYFKLPTPQMLASIIRNLATHTSGAFEPDDYATKHPTRSRSWWSWWSQASIWDVGLGFASLPSNAPLLSACYEWRIEWKWIFHNTQCLPIVWMCICTRPLGSLSGQQHLSIWVSLEGAKCKFCECVCVRARWNKQIFHLKHRSFIRLVLITIRVLANWLNLSEPLALCGRATFALSLSGCCVLMLTGSTFDRHSRQ